MVFRHLKMRGYVTLTGALLCVLPLTNGMAITTNKTTQTISTISFSPTTLNVGSTVAAIATATSGLPVTFRSTTPSICTTDSTNGNRITGISAGTCSINANQAGNNRYSPAPTVIQRIRVIGKANQTISALRFTPANLGVGRTATVRATATSGLIVSFRSTTPSICAVLGTTITAVSVGTCTVAANQTGNANYNSAPQIIKNLAVTKGNQTIGDISFTPATLTVGGTVNADARATSRLSVSFSSITPKICDMSETGDNTITGISTGTCTIAANQIGDSNYNPASQVTKNITISGTSPVSGDGPAFTMAQTISDQAQLTTLGFDGLALLTGNLDAQSFFPPGKVADYTGFQYLRDNDPDNMGHNTDFLTRIAYNVIYLLNTSQFNQLQALAVAQLEQVNLYAYKRFPLMQAFRRLIDGDIPSGSVGLNLNAVKQASNTLYLIDGQISLDRAQLYANIINSLDTSQKAYLDSMTGKGFNSWADISASQVNNKMQSLPRGTAQLVMTYASDIFSWYAGSLDADVYFCPERHGTYYGGFYMKDAPAVGHSGYSIDEQLTATAGAAISDSTKGYVTAEQANLMSKLLESQRDNLYQGTSTNIVQVRTQIATLLRSLLNSTTSVDTIKNQVLSLSSIYGNLDGENNYYYATTFAQIYRTLNSTQKSNLETLRKSILSGQYVNGTFFDYSVAAMPFLYADTILDGSVLTPYLDTDYLFFEP